jgi:hypothetical protein
MVDLFGGHVYPGTGFCVLGLWWSIITAMRYVKSEKSGDKNSSSSDSTYKTSVNMPLLFMPCAALRHPCIESILKLLASLGGIIFHWTEVAIEVKHVNMQMSMASAEHDRSIVLIHRTRHHVAIYIGFFIGAIVELFIHSGARCPKNLGTNVNIYIFFL